ncbi:MAG: hypothetical protein AAF909_10260 [Pseudomonadota bacterium]
MGAAYAALAGCAFIQQDTGFAALEREQAAINRDAGAAREQRDGRRQVLRYEAENGVRILSIIPGVYGASVPSDRPSKDVFCAFAEAVRSEDVNVVAITVLGKDDGLTSYAFERRDPGQERSLLFAGPEDQTPLTTVRELGRGCP